MKSVSLETVFSQIRLRYKNEDVNGRTCRYTNCRKFTNCAYKENNGNSCTINNKDCFVGGCEKNNGQRNEECPFKYHMFRDLQCYLLDKEFMEFQTKELGVIQGVFLFLNKYKRVEYWHTVDDEKERMELFYSVPKKENGEIRCIPDINKKEKDTTFVNGRKTHHHMEFVAFFNAKGELRQIEKDLNLIYSPSGELSFYLLWWAAKCKNNEAEALQPNIDEKQKYKSNGKNNEEQLYKNLRLLENGNKGTERYNMMIKWLKENGALKLLSGLDNIITNANKEEVSKVLKTLYSTLEGSSEDLAHVCEKMRFFAAGAYLFLQTPDDTPISFLTIPLFGPFGEDEEQHAFFKASCVGFDELDKEGKAKRVTNIWITAETIFLIASRSKAVQKFLVHTESSPRRRVAKNYCDALSVLVHGPLYQVLSRCTRNSPPTTNYSALQTALSLILKQKNGKNDMPWFSPQARSIIRSMGITDDVLKAAYEIYESYYFCEDVRFVLAKALKEVMTEHNHLALDDNAKERLFGWLVLKKANSKEFFDTFDTSPYTKEAIVKNVQFIYDYHIDRGNLRKFYVGPDDLYNFFLIIYENAFRHAGNNIDKIQIEGQVEEDKFTFNIFNEFSSTDIARISTLLENGALKELRSTLKNYGATVAVEFKGDTYNWDEHSIKPLFGYKFTFDLSDLEGRV